MLQTADEFGVTHIVKDLASLLAEGQELLASDDLPKARETFSRAVSIAEVTHGAKARELIEPLWWLSKAYRAHQYEPCEQLRLAVEAGRRAIDIAGSSAGVNPEETADLLTFHGITLWLNGEHDSAVAALTTADRMLANMGLNRSPQLGPIVEVLLDAKKPELALPYAREFLREEERMRERTAASHAMFLLSDCLRQVGTVEEAKSQIQETILAERTASNGSEELVAILQRWLAELGMRDAGGEGSGRTR